MSLGSNKARLDVSKCSTSSEDLDGLRSQVCWWTRLTTEKSQPFLYYILYLSSQPSEPRTFHPSFQVIERFASLQEEPLQRGSAFRRSPSIARFNKVYTGGHGCRFLWIKWLMCYIYIYIYLRLTIEHETAKPLWRNPTFVLDWLHQCSGQNMRGEVARRATACGFPSCLPWHARQDDLIWFCWFRHELPC